ncbi:MAG TPA: PKD domain-containing protein [Mycobacteriales bacterium]|nr:PKD domain-containing protein [Mycobacteriales bacterium]
MIIRRRLTAPRLLAGFAAIALAGTTATSAAGAATGWASHHPAANGAGSAAAQLEREVPGAKIGYAVNVPLCATKVKAGEVTCFAMRREQVRKGTAHAVPYVVNTIGPGPAHGYTPGDFAALYNYNPALKTPGQVVGIVDWYADPHIGSDLAVFDHYYGFKKETASSFRVVNQDGKTSPLPSSANGKGSAGEIALDVETVRGVCHTCRIVLVEASGPTNSALQSAENTAVRLGATEISNSWGGPERSEPASFLKAFNHPGTVITASTGDDGWFGWDFANGSSANDVSENAPEFPSTDPNVVAVGGTLTEINTSNGSIAAQEVWNENGADDFVGLGGDYPDPPGGAEGAGGGGCSSHYPAPSWQASYPGYTATGCNGKRLAADVSQDADPESGYDVYDTWGSGDNGWQTIGGTSLASPMVAAMFALAGGSGGAAYPARSMYENATLTPSSVNDVTIGGNGFCGGDDTTGCGDQAYELSEETTYNPNALGAGNLDCSFPHGDVPVEAAPPPSSECNATAGFDGPSGLGTPNGLRLFTSTSPRVSLSGPKKPLLHKPATFSAKATARVAGNHITKYTFVWGDGHSTSGKASERHTFNKKGRYDVTVEVTDSLGQQSVARKVITIGEPLKLKLFGPAKVKKGHVGKFRAAATDPNTGGKIKKIHWSWGDHRSSTGARASHAWRHTGKFSILITLVDTTGVSTRYRAKVKIT